MIEGLDAVLWFTVRRRHDRDTAGRGLADPHQRRLAQQAVFSARFEHRVVALPPWKGQCDLGSGAGSLRMKIARANVCPIEFFIQSHDAECTVVFRTLIVDGISAWQLFPRARSDFMMRRLALFRTLRPFVF